PARDAHGNSREQREDGVRDDGEQDDGDGASEHLLVAPQRDPPLDVDAESAEPDVGGEYRRRDDLERRAAQPADEQREPERRLDAGEHLPGGHPHRACGVGDGGVDVLHARVRAGEDGRDGEDDEDGGRRTVGVPDADEQGEHGEQAEGGQRPPGTGRRDGGLAAPAGVADAVAQRDRDHRGDEQREERVPEVLTDPLGERPAAGPLLGRGQPGPRLTEEPHPAPPAVSWTRRPTRPGRELDQGMSSRPTATRTTSKTSATATVATIPVTISAGIPRCSPSMNSVPRLRMPTSTPTVTRLTVLTATTRSPAS